MVSRFIRRYGKHFFVSSTHDIAANPINSADHLGRPLVIKDDVWIGANAVVLGGVVVEEGVVIGAGAVLTGTTQKHGVYVGNPARLLKFREIAN